MKRIIRYIKSLFGKYEPGYEYWVYTKDIKIPTYFKSNQPEIALVLADGMNDGE